MKLNKNLNVNITSDEKYKYKIESNQNNSSPGIYINHTIEPNTTYLITANGYVPENNGPVILWILNSSNNQFYLKSIDYQLNNNLQYKLNNGKGKYIAKIGFMFLNPKIGSIFYLNSIDITSQINNLPEKINKKRLMIIAPCPNDYKSHDGWLARIFKIDDLFKNESRIYIYFTNNIQKNTYTYKKYSNIDYYIFNSNNKEYYLQKILELQKQNESIIYIHTSHLAEYLYDILDKIKYILDMHGLAPEEELMLGRGHLVDKYNRVEEKIFNTAYKVIVVTNSMKNHFLNKYKNINMENKFIKIPIYENYDTKIINKEWNNKMNIIYSGGTQIWQNLSEVSKYKDKLLEQYNIILLSANLNDMKKIFREDKRIQYNTVSKDKLYDYYKICDLGLVLRDEHIVNRVSCPTKLIDYINYGIIPVLKSNKIGDFDEYGLKYIEFNNLINNNFDKNEFNNIIKHNFDIVNKIYIDHIKGLNELKKIIINN